MVTLSTNGASIIFDFEDSQHYLYGTGSIIAPLNSLSLVVEDDGKSITFKKGASNDIFVSVPIDEIDGMDADALVTWWEANAVGTPVAAGIQFTVVNALPTGGNSKYIYLLSTPDGWEEWIWVEGEWVAMGVMSTSFYEGKDAIQIAKSATTASAYTVSLKIADDDKFLHQTSGGVRDYANLRTSADTSGHQHIVLSGYATGEISNIKIDDYTGLSAISANNITDEISLIIDPASNTAITQSNAGLKLTVENNIKTASGSTRPPETREVFKRFDDLEIQSAQTISSTTYQLYSLDEPKNVKIEVVNDKYTSAVTIDNDNQQILLDVVQPDKTVKVLSGNMEEVIFEDDAKDGLRIDNHLLKVKIDDASNSGLTVSIDGVKSTVEPDVKVASASTRPVEAKEIYKRFSEIEIQSGETVSSTTYDLYTLDEKRDVQIEVPNDQYVSAVSIDNNNQQVLLDLKKADGSVEVLSGNMEEVLFEDDAKDGLEVDNHLLKVLIDPASNSGLTVSMDGVKLTAENNVKTASASTRPVQTDEVFRRFDSLEIKSGETVSSTTYALWSLDEEKPLKVNVPNDRYVSAITVDNDHQQIVLDVVQEDKTVQKLSGDATEIIFESDIKDGLTADTHNVKVLIDPTSNSGLTVSASGVKSTVEPDVKVASSSTRPVEAKEIYKRFSELEIKSGQTVSSTTYALWSLDEEKPLKINVPNDEHISAITVDNTNQQILLDLKKADGSVQVLSGDATEVIFESDLSDGLTAVSHNAKVLIDANTNSGLTVSATGVKLDAESNIVTASASTRPAETQEVFHRFDTLEIESARTTNADTYQLKSLNVLKDDLIEVKDTFAVVTALPLTGDAEIIYVLETTDPETSAKTYTQHIYYDGGWKQTSAQGGLDSNYEVVSALPAVADAQEERIYVLKTTGATAADDVFEMYGKIDGGWKPLGDDLSDFVINAGEY